MSIATRSLAERFWPKVDKSGGGGACWPWVGHIKRNGYGAIGAGGKYGRVLMAHRVAWELENGPIPDGLVIDHVCHERSCVNPSHLRAVPGQANNQNRLGANRTNRSGVRNVCWYAPRQQWMVRFTCNGQRYSRGYFDSIPEAEAEAIALRAAVERGETITRRPRHDARPGAAGATAAGA